jgi:hypothetical protein
MCDSPLPQTPDVHDGHGAVVAHLGQVGKRGPLEAGKFVIGPVVRPTSGRRGGTVDADPDELALGLGHLLGGLTQQRDGGSPRDESAQVGGELALDAEVEGARHEAGSESGAGAQVHHPLTGLEATS